MPFGFGSKKDDSKKKSSSSSASSKDKQKLKELGLDPSLFDDPVGEETDDSDFKFDEKVCYYFILFYFISYFFYFILFRTKKLGI
jgi:hypothetical protein